ncbi:MAG: hypothetical protein V4722_24260 [Bacteroidota bacterium]
MLKNLLKKTGISYTLLLLLIANYVPVFSQTTTTQLPCWSTINQRYWVPARLNQGTTIQNGDVVTVACLININNGGSTVSDDNGLGGCPASGTTVIPRFSYVKPVPLGTSYVAGTLKSLTARDLIYSGGATDNTANLTGSWTDAVDATDDASINAGVITFCLGAGATNSPSILGGTLSSTDKPGQAGLMIQAVFNVTITAANGSVVNLGGGTIKFRQPGGTIDYVYTLPALNVEVQQTSITTANPPVANANLFTAASNGTFGTAVTTKYSNTLGGVSGFDFVRQTAVNDGEYSVVLQTTADTRNTPPTTAPTTQNFTTSPTPANSVFYSAAGGGANSVGIAGGWDVISDHTGAANTALGNPLFADNTGSTTDGIVASSPPRGGMLLVNGAYAPATIFTQSLSGLAPNTYYKVSLWVRNICNNCHNPTGIAGPPSGDQDRTNPGVLPNIALKFDNNVVYSTGQIGYDNINGAVDATYSRNTWKQRTFLFNTSSNTSPTVSLLNFAPGSGGNDFVVDDIEMKQAVPTVTLSASPACSGSTLTISATVNSGVLPADGDFPWYKVQSSPDGSTWTDLIAATENTASPSNYTVTYTTGVITAAQNGYFYRIVTANSSANLTSSAAYIVTSAALVVNSKPEVGGPFTAFRNGSATMTAPNQTGTWTVRSSPANPGTSTITTPGAFNTTITGYSATGTYGYIWTNANGCRDTALVTVSNITVSGNVWNDVDGTATVNGAEAFGTDAGSTSLTAYLVDAGGLVVGSSDVNNTTGAYSITSGASNTAYTIRLSNTAGVLPGAAAPAASLPTGWSNTGVNLGGVANTGNQTGTISINAAGNLSNQNFAVEQPPTAGSGSNSTGNPGGTVQVTVPANTFTNGGNSTDPTASPLGVTGIRLTAFPTGATSVVINGTTYNSGTPADVTALLALNISTDGNGNPSVTITADPTSNGVTTVTFSFRARDAAGKLSANIGTAVLNFTGLTISGNVWNDVDGTATVNGSETLGTEAGSATLTAYLVDAGGLVVSSSDVNGTTGAYSLINAVGGTTYTVRISNTAGVLPGATAPAASLPAGWANTGVNLGGVANTANQTGIITVTPAANLANQNFAIEQPPTAGSGSNSAANPNGTLQVTVPANTFTNGGNSTDPTASPLGVTGIRLTAFPTGATSVVINGITYNSGTPANVTALLALIIPTDATGNPTVTITADPAVNGATTVTFNFQARDAAGKLSANTGSAVLNLTALTISGNVWNDVDGTATVNGTEVLGTEAGSATLTAYLVDAGGLVVSSSDVNVSTGAYSLINAVSGTTYTIRISNTAGVAVGVAAPAASLPTGWANTGVNLGGVANTANQTGIITLTPTGVVANQNFAVEQPPTAGSGSNSAVNPNGTVQVTVPANTFTNGANSTDPTASPLGVTGIRLTAFPTGATSVVINGTTYNSGTPADVTALLALNIPTDANGNPTVTITADPAVNGATAVTFNFQARDAAGKLSANTGSAVLNLTTLTISGNVWNDVDGTATVNGSETLGTEAGSATLTAYLVDAGGLVVSSSDVNGTTGAYSLINAASGTTYTVRISNTAGVLPGATAPVASLPTGWANTGVNLGGVANTANQTGSITVTPTGVVANQNFAVEQPPTAGSGSNSAVNPNGTVQVTVPANTFTNGANSTDPTASPLGVTGIRLTAFPTGATSVVINGTTYNSGTPADVTALLSLNIPTDANGNPTVTITADPAVNGATTVTFNFQARDAAGKLSANTGSAVLNFTALTISGNVWNDVDGTATVNGAEVLGTQAGSATLTAYLVDAGGLVVSSSDVNGTTGAYSLINAVSSTTYTVRISNTAGVLPGATAPAASLPTGWANTGVNLGGVANTANQTGSITVTPTGVVANQNFAVEQPPTAGSGSNSAVNPNGTVQVTVPANTFTNGANSTDPTASPLGVTGIRLTAFPTGATSVVINGTTYNSGTPADVTALLALNIPTDANGNPTVTITADPAVNGATAVTFNFQARDAAGKLSANTGSAVLNFTALTISGNVWNDVDGTATVNGAEVLGTQAGSATLTAYLVDAGGLVVSSSDVNGTTGAYSLINAVSGTTYTVRISNTAGVLQGATAPAASLPTGWVNTGVNLGGVANTANQTGSITITPTGVVANQNFAVEQPPVGADYTASTQINPGSTIQVTVPSAAFTGTDAEDAPGGYTVGLSGRKVRLEPATNGTVFYNGVAVNSTTNITSFDPTLVAFDPIDGDGSSSFGYSVFDNANMPSISKTITLPFAGIRTIDVTASSVCIQDAPYITYSTTANFNTTGMLATLEWVNPSGVVVSTLTNLPLSGQVLFPGAAVDGMGNGIAWPGWTYSMGQWVQVNDLNATIRLAGSKIRLTINPSDSVVISYPQASPFCHAEPPVLLSGKVWDDADSSAAGTFSNIFTNSETGTNAGGQLYVVITGKDPSDNNNIKVLGSTPVNANGTYSFNDFLRGADHQVYLSTTAGVLGSSTLPPSSIPSNWVLTTPIIRAPVDASGADLVNLDFGIELIPAGADYTAAPQNNPGSTIKVPVPAAAFTGSDPEDGVYPVGLAGRKVILNPATNGTLHYNGVPVTHPTNYNNFDPLLVSLDPVDGPNIVASFDYRVRDNGNVPSQAKTISLPFVQTSVTLQVKVLLQGSLLGNGPGLETTMRDNLRSSTYASVLGTRYIPNADPYALNSDYSGLFTKVGDGANPAYQTVVSPSTMFADRSGTSTSAVDWVFIELRDKNNPATILGTRSAIVQQDGTVVDIDGNSCIRFPSLLNDDYYVAVRHRNHLGAMTALPKPATTFNCSSVVDFTTMTDAQIWHNPATPQYDGLEMAQVTNTITNTTYKALWAGNANTDNKVKYQGGTNDRTLIQSNVIDFPGNVSLNINYDLAFGYFKGDINLDSKTKYQGGANDRTILQSLVLGFLLNSTLNINYDLFVQQLP